MTLPAVSAAAGSRPEHAPGTGVASARPVVELLATWPAFEAAAGAAGARVPTGFQALPWLAAVYRHLAPPAGAEPLLVAVRDARTGEIAMLLALEVRREAHVAIARFADLGVCDYNAPIGSAGGPDAAAIVAALKGGLHGVDVLLLERMQAAPGNPFPAHRAAEPARHDGNALTVADSVEAYIRSRGKKYRKEVERCYRLLQGEGAWRFERAISPAEVDAAFSALERQQAERHADKADDYALDAPQFSAFYRDALSDPSGVARIFTLNVDGAIIAVLLGIVHGSTFTALRIANGGADWRHLSPGRLIVVEAMKYFDVLGVRTFDMGIGDYAFKRGFGAEPVALFDLAVPLTFRGMLYVAARRLKGHLRRNDRLRALVQRLRGSSRV